MMTEQSKSETVKEIFLPIKSLPSGEICPPFGTDHESWKILEGWDDPLAPWAGYKVGSGKTRIDEDGRAAIEFIRGADIERGFATGESTWRECSMLCRLKQVQSWEAPAQDGWFIRDARAGLVFRMETSRRFYYFCIEGQRRMVLYRRIDDEWFELAAREVVYAERTITLRVELVGDGIRASCPELDVELFATDSLIKSGKAGFRARGGAVLYKLKIAISPSQRSLNEQRADILSQQAKRLSASLPDEEEVGVIELSGRRILFAADFARRGVNDLLFVSEAGLIAESFEGDLLWTLPEVRPTHIKISSESRDGARRIFMMLGERYRNEIMSVRGLAKSNIVADEMMVVDGASGRTLSRAKLPDVEDIDNLRCFDFSYETGRLSGKGFSDFIVRVWRRGVGGGGWELWAYDEDLNPLWEAAVDPPYGHHGAVHLVDIDKDGWSEVIAGGTLLSANGELIARHDLSAEMGAICAAGHYDSVLMGDFAGDDELDPTAFLISGSAGVYVIDPLTGRTRSVHRIGHAQWGMRCKLREDIPGEQLIAGTRWGNYGILTCFSGRGEKLWSIQPDYLLQGSTPVNWVAGGIQHIWINTSQHAQGLYDGYGRMVKPLDSIRRLWGGRTPMEVNSLTMSRAPEELNMLGVEVDDRLHLFGPKDSGVWPFKNIRKRIKRRI